MRKNLFASMLALFCLLAFCNVSLAQDCKNGKCPNTGKTVMIVPQGFAQGGSCQLSSKTVTTGGGCAGCSGGCNSTVTSSFKSSTTVSTGQHKGIFQRIKERHGR